MCVTKKFKGPARAIVWTVVWDVVWAVVQAAIRAIVWAIVHHIVCAVHTSELCSRTPSFIIYQGGLATDAARAPWLAERATRATRASRKKEGIVGSDTGATCDSAEVYWQFGLILYHWTVRFPIKNINPDDTESLKP